MGGVVLNYYEPEGYSEFVPLLKSLNGKDVDVVGHTTNIYFKESYNPENLISTKKLNKWAETENHIICDCGVSMRKLSLWMIENGYKGYEGLVDLPGTIGGAVYGNSGCFGCLVSDLIETVEVLLQNGEIKTFKRDECHFRKRISIFKEGRIKGTILRVTINKIKGDEEELREKARLCTQLRKDTQPSPKCNLGTTYCDFGERTTLGLVIGKLGGLYVRLLKLLMLSESKRNKLRWHFEFSLAGGKSVIPYLFSPERFIWKDERAHEVFIKYQALLNRLYRNPKMEIEIRG